MARGDNDDTASTLTNNVPTGWTPEHVSRIFLIVKAVINYHCLPTLP